MVHLHRLCKLLLGLELMVEIIFVVDNVTEDTVSLEKGHEANEPQIFKVVLLFWIEVDIHFHGLNSL